MKTDTYNSSDVPAQDTTYNGWANYETWNVALWIGNDEGLYHLAREYQGHDDPYAAFRRDLAEISPGQPIAFQTPDGVAWRDSGIDVDAINAMIEEL